MDSKNVPVKEVFTWGSKAIELYGRYPKPSILAISAALQYGFGYESATYERVYRHLTDVSQASLSTGGKRS